MSTVLKFFACEKAEINEEDRSVTAYITTETIDRDREIVVARGGDLDNYRKNPVVLWAHDYKSQPVARNLWIRADGKGLLAKTQYANTPRAEEIWQLRKDGFLKGYSIGFVPKPGKTADGLPAYGPPHEKEIKINPDWKDARNIIRAWEMVEYSDVPIPCNPEALSRAYEAKSLQLSAGLAKEFSLPEIVAAAPPLEEASPTVYSFGGQDLKKAVKKAARQLQRDLRKQILDDLPEMIKEQLHVAGGGV